MVQMAVTVDENVKHDIEKLYNSLGMNINTAVNLFFQQCLIEQGFPSDILSEICDIISGFTEIEETEN